MCADNMTSLAFDGSELDAGVDSHLHRTPTVVREGMFAVVDGMDLRAGEALRKKG